MSPARIARVIDYETTGTPEDEHMTSLNTLGYFTQEKAA